MALIITGCVVGFTGLLLLIGGVVTRVEGVWLDGDRSISLRRTGPIVQGECQREGGGERYVGFCLFGAVRLSRYAFGDDYIVSLGFKPEHAKLLEDEPLARLSFRLHGDLLRGTFQGREMTLDENPPKIAAVKMLEPTDRHWVR